MMLSTNSLYIVGRESETGLTEYYCLFEESRFTTEACYASILYSNEATEIAYTYGGSVHETNWIRQRNESIQHLFKLERAYQDVKYKEREHSIAEWLLIVKKKLDQAFDSWYYYGGSNMPEYHLVQVAAVCIAALEQADRKTIYNLYKRLSTKEWKDPQ